MRQQNSTLASAAASSAHDSVANALEAQDAILVKSGQLSSATDTAAVSIRFHDGICGHARYQTKLIRQETLSLHLTGCEVNHSVLLVFSTTWRSPDGEGQ
jgi:hypothetical protein